MIHRITFKMNESLIENTFMDQYTLMYWSIANYCSAPRITYELILKSFYKQNE